jgi:hypothetical protein
VSKCTTCGAQIIWCRTETGKRISLDANPSAEGNLTLGLGELLPTAYSVSRGRRKPGQLLYKKHLASCKQEMAHRQKTPKKRLPPPGEVLFEGGGNGYT